jgi:PPOX class probable F420-dependent enzyme
MTKLSEEARKLFEDRNFAFVATVMPDGSPQVSPVWVDLEDGRILVNTVLGRQKERNMRRDPRVAVSVFDHDDPERHVDVRGRVVDFVPGDTAERHIDELSRKYRGVDPYDDHSPDKPRVIAKIEPERVYEGL